jgi:hypothetical protein
MTAVNSGEPLPLAKPAAPVFSIRPGRRPAPLFPPGGLSAGNVLYVFIIKKAAVFYNRFFDLFF